MNQLKIAAGIVLGLLCWNLLLAWSEDNTRYSKEQDKQKGREYLKQEYDKADAECKKGDADACAERSRIYLIMVKN